MGYGSFQAPRKAASRSHGEDFPLLAVRSPFAWHRRRHWRGRPWLNGAGRFLLNSAKLSGADIFITSDFKYHDFFDAENRVLIADIGHYESEQYTMNLIADFLRKNFPKFAIHLSKVNTNPINYL